THWFSPAYLIPLVEVVPGGETSEGVITTTVNMLEKLGKKPVVLKEFVPGFIVNRLQNAINATMFEMIGNGWASPENIDLAIKSTLGIRLPIVGIAQSLDFAGLDLINTISRQQGWNSAFVEKKVSDGHLGAKTGKGIYDYGRQSESEILRKRDRLYFRMLAFLEEINAFDPV
ncbi:MAG: 3-hydroxyacyl-CoA dehydrogenase family protein, partial [Deltaproteobacteria bacterium]|nr:3-hydroxyacyl-CoA dehydrogenase family protein [Deltaproteobacteria bacterium]